MQEIYSVSVKTADGKSLVALEITGDFFSLSFILSRLSHIFLHRGEDILASEIRLGSGTPQSLSLSPSPTES